MNNESKKATVALLGLAAFTGLAGSAEAAVANVQTKVEALRSAKASSIRGNILNGITKMAVGSFIAQQHNMSHNMTHSQTHSQTLPPVLDATAA